MERFSMLIIECLKKLKARLYAFVFLEGGPSGQL